MAVKKTLIEAVPASEGGKVTQWALTMKYEQGTEGQADYYTNEKTITIQATETAPDDSTKTNFTAKAEGDWTRKELEDLCPTTKWDEVITILLSPANGAATLYISYAASGIYVGSTAIGKHGRHT